MPLPAKTRFQPEYDMYSKIASLKIKDVRPTDVGEYKCLAENKVGKDETSALAYVLKTPNIDEKAYINPERFRDLIKTPEF